MKKNIAVAIAIALASSIICYFGYQKYKLNEFIELASPHIKNTSLRVANELGYELDQSTKITFKEIFNKLEEDISEMDKRNLEVQTITNAKNKDISAPAVEYIKACQVLARSLLDYNRKLLGRNSASDWADSQLADYKASIGTYSSEYAKKSTDKAINDLEKANSDYFETMPGIIDSAKKLKASREVASKIFQNEALVSQDRLDELINKFTPKENNKIPAKK